MEPQVGIEPTTSILPRSRSSRLSYEGMAVARLTT